jgi:hypothetical protein
VVSSDTNRNSPGFETAALFPYWFDLTSGRANPLNKPPRSFFGGLGQLIVGLVHRGREKLWEAGLVEPN